MKRIIKKLTGKASNLMLHISVMSLFIAVANIALHAANISAGSASYAGVYQPEEPQQLRELA